MIIVKLNGGLGNQLFQYALGRRVAIITGVPLKLDISALKVDPLRTFRLHNLNIMAEIASDDEVRSLIGQSESAVLSKVRRIIRNKSPDKSRAYIKERKFSFDPEVLAAPPDAYLEGYWQSERYFKEIAQTLRSEFTVKSEMDSTNRILSEKILETQSVSIHIRRGDYITNPVTNEYHGVCPLDYYHRATKMLSATVKEPHFFIFSDDPRWVETNLHLPFPTMPVTINGIERDYDDLRLMSLCNHHIIANSTFSWWGAWLSRNPEKQVYAPRQWFRSNENDASDLIPSSWITI